MSWVAGLARFSPSLAASKWNFTGMRISDSRLLEVSVSTSDHVENTGDNLRHAAEVTHPANDEDAQIKPSPEHSAADNPLPDFNT